MFQNILRLNSQLRRLNVVSDSTKLLQFRCYAARKGTRERKSKKKIKVEEVKVGFIPHNQRNREEFLKNRPTRKFDDSNKRDPVDNVFVCKYYKWVNYPLSEAVDCLRETHHPDIYNKPEANVHVTVELNMQAEKATRFVDNFTRIVAIPNKFEHGEERLILAFAKNLDEQKDAQDAGATMVGGSELIKQIQNGQVSITDYRYIVAHPNILPELVSLRGLMKRRFPNPKAGTLTVELKEATSRFLNGICYTASKDEYEKDFGIIETVIGNLKMENKQLDENFAALIRDVFSMRPKREGTFISRCILWSPPSPEKLKVNHTVYLNEVEKETVDKEQEEVEAVAL